MIDKYLTIKPSSPKHRIYMSGGRTDTPNDDSELYKVLGKTAVQLLDPTGISSYPDVYYAGKELFNNPTLENGTDFLINLVGALPLIGKFAAPAKIAKAAKRTKKIIEGAETTRRINRVIDTVPELVPGIRKVSEKTQDATSRVLAPVVRKYAPKNKYSQAGYYNGINTGVDIYNIGNSFIDTMDLINYLGKD